MEADLDVFRAFSDETRLRILFLLAERELCVCEVVAVLEMPQGKISRHLAVMKRAGLLSVRRDSTWIYYSLRKPEAGLTRRLLSYLKSEREGHPIAVADLQRLRNLAGKGKICVPKPSAAPALSRD